jgi:hypothetical protein
VEREKKGDGDQYQRKQDDGGEHSLVQDNQTVCCRGGEPYRGVKAGVVGERVVETQVPPRSVHGCERIPGLQLPCWRKGVLLLLFRGSCGILDPFVTVFVERHCSVEQ